MPLPQTAFGGVPWEQSGSAPHCDQRVLHAPGECESCDLFPNWQQARIVQGVAFTGREPVDGEVFDPASLFRTAEQINAWPGNRPYREVDNR